MLDIRSFGAIGETAMTSDRAIEITGRGLPSTFVPGRNLVFLVYAAALADRRGLTALVGGMCETDFSGYPDCRRDTLDATEQALNLGMAQDFRVETPLMRLTKAETWGLAKALGGEPLVADHRRGEPHLLPGRARDPASLGPRLRCLPRLRAAPAGLRGLGR